jgi:demethylmenaquinone methyltransferase/2-methoxy-6-polyprenyl-1,4-benzoquinol methylase
MSKEDKERSLLDQQIEYYRARAPEYDEWFLRKGRYDRGQENNRRWFAEVEQVRKALDVFQPAGHVLELACGTGLWTELLIQYAIRVTAVDAAPEALAINRERLKSNDVDYVRADLFSWNPPQLYDVVFFGFWLSHVPPEHFEDFWILVARALKPGGRVFFVDSKRDSTSTAKDHILQDPDSQVSVRKLNDGREFSVVKIFYEPLDLENRLAKLGWRFEVCETPSYFIFGSGLRHN